MISLFFFKAVRLQTERDWSVHESSITMTLQTLVSFPLFPAQIETSLFCGLRSFGPGVSFDMILSEFLISAVAMSLVVGRLYS